MKHSSYQREVVMLDRYEALVGIVVRVANYRNPIVDEIEDYFHSRKNLKPFVILDSVENAIQDVAIYAIHQIDYHVAQHSIVEMMNQEPIDEVITSFKKQEIEDLNVRILNEVLVEDLTSNIIALYVDEVGNVVVRSINYLEIFNLVLHFIKVQKVDQPSNNLISIKLEEAHVDEVFDLTYLGIEEKLINASKVIST